MTSTQKARPSRLRVIDGHRDTNDTACPGENIYSELRRIRNRTQMARRQLVNPLPGRLGRQASYAVRVGHPKPGGPALLGFTV